MLLICSKKKKPSFFNLFKSNGFARVLVLNNFRKVLSIMHNLKMLLRHQWNDWKDLTLVHTVMVSIVSSEHAGSTLFCHSNFAWYLWASESNRWHLPFTFLFNMSFSVAPSLCVGRIVGVKTSCNKPYIISAVAFKKKYQKYLYNLLMITDDT